MVGIDGELGVDEEKNGLLDLVQTSKGSAIRAGNLHLDEGFRD